MNVHPSSASGGDGRPPPRDTKRFGVSNAGPSKKSKRRRHRQNRSPHLSQGTEQANPVSTAADLTPDYQEKDVMRDATTDLMDRAAGSCLAARVGAAAAQVEAMQASAAHTSALQNSMQIPGTQASAMQAAAALAAGAQVESARAAMAHIARSLEAEPVEASSSAPSSSSAPRVSSRRSPSAGASNANPELRCPYCRRVYTTRWGLQRHVTNSHDQANLFHCIRCRFSASDRQTLQAHRGDHVLQYTCPGCGKRFPLAEHHDHMRTCGSDS